MKLSHCITSLPPQLISTTRRSHPKYFRTANQTTGSSHVIIMQKPPSSARPSARRKPILKSCSECRRRKQKCILSAPGEACVNCAKRWPVECVFPQDNDKKSKSSRLRAGDIEVEVTSSVSQNFRRRHTLYTPLHPMQWAIYLLPGQDSGSAAGREDIVESRRSSQIDDSGYEEQESTVYGGDGSRSKSSLVICGQGFSEPPGTSIGGVLSAIDCVNSSPVENTSRNTELLYFFLQFVAPNLVSIDGESMPFLFRSIMLPWMLQSHLFPNIAILMASVVQVLEKGEEAPEFSSEPLAIKVKVLGMINRVLGSGQYDLSDVLRSVINLVIIEWFWGADESMWAHLRGLKELVDNRGGPGAINDPLFATVLVLADYAVACCFETDLCIQDGEYARKSWIACPALPNESLVCPLGEHPRGFADLKHKLHLSNEAAVILDDVRFLTFSIASPGTSTCHPAKIRSTASRIHKRIQDLDILIPQITDGDGKDSRVSTEEAIVTATIRLAALIYADAIMSVRPISHVRDDEATKTLCNNLRAVSSNRWKRVPGIFLWLLVVAAPQIPNTNRGGESVDVEKDLRNKYLRRKMATAAQVIGQEEFNLSIWYLRSFWVVQRWIFDQSTSKTEEAQVADIVGGRGND